MCIRDSVKIGIIGCGGIAKQKHLPSLKADPRAELVAFCDLIEERAQWAAKEYGAPDAKVYTDYRELLRDPEIEVVHVLTPNRSHCELTCDALRAGKHVMCEKPMAKTYADAKKMLETAKETGKKLTIGYQNRFRPDSQYLKGRIDVYKRQAPGHRVRVADAQRAVHQRDRRAAGLRQLRLLFQDLQKVHRAHALRLQKRPLSGANVINVQRSYHKTSGCALLCTL